MSKTELKEEFIQKANTPTEVAKKIDVREPLTDNNMEEKPYAKKENMDIIGTMPEIIPEQANSKQILDMEHLQDVAIFEDDPKPEKETTDTAEQPSQAQSTTTEPIPKSDISEAKKQEEIKKMVDTSQLSPEEKNESSEFLVDMILDAHQWIYNIGSNLAKISEQKIEKNIAKGKWIIEVFTLKFEVDDGDFRSVKEIVDDANQQIDRSTNKEEFHAQVKPLMVKLFVAKGWGLKLEHYIAYLFIKDTAQTVISMGAIAIATRTIISDATKGLIEENPSLQRQPQKSKPKPQTTAEPEQKKTPPPEPKQEPQTEANSIKEQTPSLKPENATKQSIKPNEVKVEDLHQIRVEQDYYLPPDKPVKPCKICGQNMLKYPINKTTHEHCRVAKIEETDLKFDDEIETENENNE